MRHDPCSRLRRASLITAAALLSLVSLSAWSEDTAKTDARDRIAAECEKLRKKVGGLSDYWLESCIKKQMEHFDRGEPNFATHSKAEVAEYMNEDSDDRTQQRREDNPELLNHIEEKCAETAVVLVVIPNMKTSGKTQSDARALLQDLADKLEDPPLGDIIVKNTAQELVDDVYANDADTDAVISESIDLCRTRYEEAMMLR